METLQLETWQMVLAAALYIAYLCWVMFGGMKRKKIKPVVYVTMTLLMLYGVIKEFNGVSSRIEVVNIVVILMIGLVKGIYLGRKKIVEEIDGVWYMHHDGKYILAWVAFYVVKIIFSQSLKMIFGAEFPLWHMILYFLFYYPWRTINVFINNPEMRRDVLSKNRK